MEIHLPKIENWYALNEKVHQFLGLPKEVSIRTYRGIHHAAFEVAQGTATFMSHKRSVGWLKGQTYAFSTAMPYLYKEAFGVQQLSLKNPVTDCKVWAEALKKDTSFVMMNDDHPITGEVFDLDELDSILNDKKIFSLRVSHQQHWVRGIPNIRPSSVVLCDAGEDLAFAVVGSKFKSPVQISSHFAFDEESVLSKIKSMKTQGGNEGGEDLALIQKFEAQLPSGFQQYPRGSAFLHDRSLIWHPEINGEALATELNLNSAVIALTGCAQGFADLEWWEDRPTPEQMRGLIILNLQAMKKLVGTQLLEEAVQRCRI